jgi:hypothetical protein
MPFNVLSATMTNKVYFQCLPFVIIGIYMVIMGAVSKTLISESDMPATEEEKASDKPTPVRRLLVILAGVGCIVYGLLCLRH